MEEAPGTAGSEGEPGEAAEGPGEGQPRGDARFLIGSGVSSDGPGPLPSYFQGLPPVCRVTVPTVLLLLSPGQQGLSHQSCSPAPCSSPRQTLSRSEVTLGN